MRRPGPDPFRVVWIVAVSIILAGGAAVVLVARPTATTGPALLPAELATPIGSSCIRTSGAEAAGLPISFSEEAGRLRGRILTITGAGPGDSSTPAERAAVERRLNRCLAAYSFGHWPVVVTGSGAATRLRIYQISRYRPCLAAHGIPATRLRVLDHPPVGGLDSQLFAIFGSLRPGDDLGTVIATAEACPALPPDLRAS
jgi:hypothetical protein